MKLKKKKDKKKNSKTIDKAGFRKSFSILDVIGKKRKRRFTHCWILQNVLLQNKNKKLSADNVSTNFIRKSLDQPNDDARVRKGSDYPITLISHNPPLNTHSMFGSFTHFFYKNKNRIRT